MLVTNAIVFVPLVLRLLIARALARYGFEVLGGEKSLAGLVVQDGSDEHFCFLKYT